MFTVEKKKSFSPKSLEAGQVFSIDRKGLSQYPIPPIQHADVHREVIQISQTTAMVC